VTIINPEPLAVNAFETINGWMRMKANSMRSYDITAEIGSGTGAYTARQGKWALHEQTYYFEQYASELDQHPENFGLYEK
jgi:histone-arginine methyltransferase CARM1